MEYLNGRHAVVDEQNVEAVKMTGSPPVWSAILAMHSTTGALARPFVSPWNDACGENQIETRQGERKKRWSRRGRGAGPAGARAFCFGGSPPNHKARAGGARHDERRRS